MADRVHRVALFNIPKREDQEALVEAYRKVKETNQKGGKKYILAISVGLAEEDVRAQGYTLIAELIFANLEDVHFYDSGCPAHQSLKGVVKTLSVNNIVTTTFQPLIASHHLRNEDS